MSVVTNLFDTRRMVTAPAKLGRWGFTKMSTIHIDKQMVASVFYGGPSQQGWLLLDVPGTGCQRIQDSNQLLELAALPEAGIRRLDIALTTVNGEVTHEQVVAAHAAGLFSSGGKNPHLQRIENSNPSMGNSCAIGTRAKSDKYLRGYERGRYLTHGDQRRQRPTGDPSLAYRLELELKVQTRPIPWDAIDRRDEVFAGSYPYLAGLLPRATPYRLPRLQAPSAAQALEEKLVNVKRQYGDVFHTALWYYGGDVNAVMSRIVGSKHSQSLKALAKPGGS